jgi:excisionase family DNA binding protein
MPDTNVVMLTTRSNRLDPSMVPEEELEKLAKFFAKPDHVALIDQHGNQTHLPEALFNQFARIVRLMSDRKAIVLVPEDEAFTTQAAANYLGMSRQHLVGLLERDEIPYHKVGSHRRVSFKDLLAYEKVRDASRRKAIDKLADAVEEAGLYDSEYAGGE